MTLSHDPAAYLLLAGLALLALAFAMRRQWLRLQIGIEERTIAIIASALIVASVLLAVASEQAPNWEKRRSLGALLFVFAYWFGPRPRRWWR